jgi:hypothetical protein
VYSRRQLAHPPEWVGERTVRLLARFGEAMASAGSSVAKGIRQRGWLAFAIVIFADPAAAAGGARWSTHIHIVSGSGTYCVARLAEVQEANGKFSLMIAGTNISSWTVSLLADGSARAETRAPGLGAFSASTIRVSIAAGSGRRPFEFWNLAHGCHYRGV